MPLREINRRRKKIFTKKESPEKVAQTHLGFVDGRKSLPSLQTREYCLQISMIATPKYEVADMPTGNIEHTS